MKKIAMIVLGLSMSASAFAGVTMNCTEQKGIFGGKEKLFDTSDLTSAGELELADAVGIYSGTTIHGQRQYHLSISADGMAAKNIYTISTSGSSTQAQSGQSSQMDQIGFDQSAPVDQGFAQEGQMGQGGFDQSGQMDQGGIDQSGQMNQGQGTTLPPSPASPASGPDKIKVKLGLENSGIHKDCETIKSGQIKDLYFTYLFNGCTVKVKCKVGYTK